MAVSTETTTGTMRATEFDFTFVLYNSKGLKAQDVLDGAFPEQYDGVFSYETLICGAFQWVWFEIYPNGGSKDETLESLMLLNPTSDTSLGGDQGGHDLDKDMFDENLHHEIASGNNAQTQFQSHVSTHDLKLDGQFPKLTAGVDIDCPLNVPPKTASGKVNICQRFTATFRISSPENVSASSVRADVTAMYNDAFKDGTWTKAYLEVDSRYVVFRVPGHNYCELYYKASNCDWLFSRHDETNNTTGQRKHSLNAVGIGCILLLLSIFGAFVYKKRAASSSFGSEGSEEEEEEEEFRDEKLIEDGRSMYELRTLRRRSMQ